MEDAHVAVHGLGATAVYTNAARTSQIVILLVGAIAFCECCVCNYVVIHGLGVTVVSHTLTYTYTNAHTHGYMYTHKHTHTCTHTHTHTQLKSGGPNRSSDANTGFFAIYDGHGGTNKDIISVTLF